MTLKFDLIKMRNYEDGSTNAVNQLDMNESLHFYFRYSEEFCVSSCIRAKKNQTHYTLFHFSEILD
jgi:hypothetical protein